MGSTGHATERSTDWGWCYYKADVHRGGTRARSALNFFEAPTTDIIQWGQFSFTFRLYTPIIYKLPSSTPRLLSLAPAASVYDGRPR